MGNRRIFIPLTGIIRMLMASGGTIPTRASRDHQEWQHVLLSVRFEAVRGWKQCGALRCKD